MVVSQVLGIVRALISAGSDVQHSMLVWQKAIFVWLDVMGANTQATKDGATNMAAVGMIMRHLMSSELTGMHTRSGRATCSPVRRLSTA